MVYIEQILWVMPVILLSLIIPNARMRVRRGGILTDIVIACICGCAVPFITNAYIVDNYIDNGSIVASDYTRYCENVGAVRSGTFDQYVRVNSILPALLPGALSAYVGILDGLLYTSMFATFAVITGLYAWGRALGGRLSGILSTLFFAAIAPLSVIVREPTFYPEMTAVSVWTMASTALALRYVRPATFLLSGCSIALSLLIDPRGLLWAAPVLAINLVACLYESARPRGNRLRHRVLMSLALIAPIVFSFPLGRYVYLPDTTSLELQVALSIEDQARSIGLEYHGDRTDITQPLHGGYIWGWSHPKTWVNAILSVKQQRDHLVDSLRGADASKISRVANVWPRYVAPFVGISLASIIVIFIRNRNDRRLLLAVTASASIPLLMMTEVAKFLVLTRQIQSTIAVLPVIIGVAIATLTSGRIVPHPKLFGFALWKVWLRPVFVIVSCVLLVTGTIDSYISPRAAWRIPLVANTTIRRIINIARYNGVTHNKHDEACRVNTVYDMTVLDIPNGTTLYQP